MGNLAQQKAGRYWRNKALQAVCGKCARSRLGKAVSSGEGGGFNVDDEGVTGEGEYDEGYGVGYGGYGVSTDGEGINVETGEGEGFGTEFYEVDTDVGAGYGGYGVSTEDGDITVSYGDGDEIGLFTGDGEGEDEDEDDGEDEGNGNIVVIGTDDGGDVLIIDEVPPDGEDGGGGGSGIVPVKKDGGGQVTVKKESSGFETFAKVVAIGAGVASISYIVWLLMKGKLLVMANLDTYPVRVLTAAAYINGFLHWDVDKEPVVNVDAEEVLNMYLTVMLQADMIARRAAKQSFDIPQGRYPFKIGEPVEGPLKQVTQAVIHSIRCMIDVPTPPSSSWDSVAYAPIITPAQKARYDEMGYAPQLAILIAGAGVVLAAIAGLTYWATKRSDKQIAMDSVDLREVSRQAAVLKMVDDYLNKGKEPPQALLDSLKPAASSEERRSWGVPLGWGVIGVTAAGLLLWGGQRYVYQR